MIQLFRKNQLGIGTWKIWYEIFDNSNATLHYAHATTLGGSEVHHKDHIVTNMSGRNIEQQVQLEMNSRISRQRDKGYKDSIDEARVSLTNQMGFMNPMLAQPLEKVRLTERSFRNAYVQKKYDGHRSLITNFNGDIVPYTRKGKPITTIDHILKELGQIIPEGVTLDGELYIHGVALQGISSIIKRAQPDNLKLKFHWYDVHDKGHPGLTYHHRLQLMRDLLSGMGEASTFELVPTYQVASMEEAMTYFRQFRAEKYEGAILRLDTRPYQDSVRSSSLIKIKDWLDCEVTVRGVRPSKEGWAILDCELDNGKRFDTSAPGSVPEKTEVMLNPGKYIGRRLTIEYATLTNDGVPFHASALRWREDL